jgi:hypothetical protein
MCGEKEAFLYTKLAIGLRTDKWHHSKKGNGREKQIKYNNKEK